MENKRQAQARKQSRSRSRSRPRRSDGPHLHRILSSQFPDDHSVYHHEDGEGVHVDDDARSLHKTETERREIETSSSDDDDSLNDVDEKEEASNEKDDAAHADERTREEIRGGIPNEHDVEASAPTLEKKTTTRSTRDPNLVTWDSVDDPANPKNWSTKRKWAATFIVSSFTLVSPISSSMIAPALTSISAEFNIKSDVEAALTLSIFVLAYAIGPLFLGPLSEIYGRVLVLQLSNLFYLAWNLGCGFAQSSGQLMAFRFFSGLGGSAPLAIGGGLLSDCFLPEQRGRAISIYSLAPLLGPAIGPIAGGFISENTTWRWCFYATTIFTAIVQCFGFFFLQETYAPKLLAWKRDRMRKETGNMELYTEFDRPDRTLATTIKVALQRPFKLLGTQPIIIVLACYMAYLYGLMYLMLSTFPGLWTIRYGMSVGIGSLNFISMGLGFFLGTQITAPLNDALYRRLKKRNNGVGKPEFRVPLMVPASLLVPIGLFLYGWSAQKHTHWIVPNIGACIFCGGVIVGFQCIQTYLVDSYTRYAASAIAAATVLRSLAGFGFPLFAPAMYRALDFGWGNSLLGFVAIALGVPAPFMLWKFGATLRAKSKFAAG
ncbi:putative MFS multidrug transporter [Cucurbitaria berberidis CBS 394.84]|uniref:MFS multidrug transporter n=1 Tax=Cucurbitaria berberidis CBS 394.84 TaxID=1168544 RepID=A0A9P4G972_9PLEO|nr:putative MFS multidrug transporter [Cucurbitaria berberidis CBS 394.84]KAF1841382.1 putative MFS multidrug transporter [Cucurbitaria berberidis CBS 394.84]